MSAYVERITELLFSGLFGPSSEPELRFDAVQVQPHLFIKRDDSGFAISGPHYSVVGETAKYLNYSLHGVHILDEDMLDVVVQHRTHFAVTDISPVLEITILPYTGEFVKRAFASTLEKNPFLQDFLEGMKFGGITKVLGMLEMDVIMQYDHKKPKAMFAFVETFTFTETWFLILVFALLVSLLLTARHIRYFWLFSEYVILCTFGSPTIKKSHLAPFLVVTWTTMLWVLEQYYDGDMVKALMEVERLNVLDSLDDLHRHPEKTIYIPSTQTFGKRDPDLILEAYYQGYQEFRDDFKRRTVVFEYLHHLQDEDYIFNLFYKLGHKPIIGLSRRGWALYVQNKVILNYKDQMYLSKRGGDFQPHFFLNLMFADLKLKSAMDYVILCLTEAGIYQRWVKWATYNYRDQKAPTLLAKYETAPLSLLYGPGYICFGLLCAAAAPLCYENAKSLMAEYRRYLALKCLRKVQKVNEWQRLRRQQKRMQNQEKRKRQTKGRQRVCSIQRDAVRAQNS